MSDVTYDALVHDTAFSFLLRERFRYRRAFLRLNDDPRGFAPQMHPWLVDKIFAEIQTGIYEEVWAVSEPLAEAARGCAPGTPVRIVPNGVDTERFRAGSAERSIGKRAVYLGAFNPWFDSALLEATAEALPHWTFDCFGPVNQRAPSRLLPNLNVRGPIPYHYVSATLRKYRVGLIPIHGDPHMLKSIDPLKSLQHLDTGLAVASTGQGRLREALGNLACYGETPATFAGAVEAAGQLSWDPAFIAQAREHLAGRSWSAIAGELEPVLRADLSQAGN